MNRIKGSPFVGGFDLPSGTDPKPGEDNAIEHTLGIVQWSIAASVERAYEDDSSNNPGARGASGEQEVPLSPRSVHGISAHPSSTWSRPSRAAGTR
jgi:hypothetical protein